MVMCINTFFLNYHPFSNTTVVSPSSLQPTLRQLMATYTQAVKSHAQPALHRLQRPSQLLLLGLHHRPVLRDVQHQTVLFRCFRNNMKMNMVNMLCEQHTISNGVTKYYYKFAGTNSILT